MSFIEIIEHELRDTNYHKSESIWPDDIRVICYYWASHTIIFDILPDENECSLTTKTLSRIYAYYPDDFEEVALKVSHLIYNILKDPKNK